MTNTPPSPATESPRHPSPELERLRRRRRTRRIIVSVVLLFLLMTALESYVLDMGVPSPFANNVLVFALVNLNIIALIALVLVILRNLVKLYFERKSKIIGSKFKTKLVLAFVGLALVPSVALFLVASGIITSSIETWFSIQVERSLEESMAVAKTYYHSLERRTILKAQEMAEDLAGRGLLADGGEAKLWPMLATAREDLHIDALQVFGPNRFNIASVQDGDIKVNLLSEGLKAEISEKAHRGGGAVFAEPLKKGEVIRAVAPVFADGAGGKLIGLVVATSYMPESLVGRLKGITTAFDEYKQIKVFKKPIKAHYIILFLLFALLIIFCAIWFAFYLARGITIPIQVLAEGTHAIAQGNLDFHIDVKADDEIGMLVDSFNKMTYDLKVSKGDLEQAAENLRSSNVELDERRSYIETILQNIKTGVISIDQHGAVSTINLAAQSMLQIEEEGAIGRPYDETLKELGLTPFAEAVAQVEQDSRRHRSNQVHVTVGGQVLTLVINITALSDADNNPLGVLVVFEDLTELIKAQRAAAWQEVARRIAHEIKNPLTPIQLSAERVLKKYRRGTKGLGTILEPSIQTIVTEVKGLKRLVDEFSRFARMPEVQLVPSDIHRIIEESITLYRTSHRDLTIDQNFASDVPTINVDNEQMKRVFTNLIENAVEAMGNGGRIAISTSYDTTINAVLIEVADEGVGVAPEDKDKLFLPYFSTKRDGTGLGLAIVDRIIADHSGYIRIEDNAPRGTKVVIELPAEA
ncbi:MAG: ATP-binding protein [bacterium]|nr:ATP-binding protein [bacterium]